jgi:hypothetical protein
MDLLTADDEEASDGVNEITYQQHSMHTSNFSN